MTVCQHLQPQECCNSPHSPISPSISAAHLAPLHIRPRRLQSFPMLPFPADPRGRTQSIKPGRPVCPNLSACATSIYKAFNFTVFLQLLTVMPSLCKVASYHSPFSWCFISLLLQITQGLEKEASETLQEWCLLREWHLEALVRRPCLATAKHICQ